MSLRSISPLDRLEADGDRYQGSLGALRLLERGEGALAGLLVNEESDRLLAIAYVCMLMMAREIGDAAWGSDLGPGRAIIDPAVCESYALPYAAQAVLSTMPIRRPGETIEEWEVRSRDELSSTSRPWSGTKGALRAAARPFLTGTRSTRIIFNAGDLWTIELRVRDDEVTDLPGLEAAVNDDFVVRAGQEVVVTPVTPGSAWSLAELEDSWEGRTLAELEDEFATLAALEDNPGGL